MRGLFVVVAIAGSGCAPATTTTTAATTTTTAAISLVGVTEGQDVGLVAGAQGGFHVWMQYAVSGFGPATVALERSARRVSDGAVVLVYRGDVDVGVAAEDGWWSAPAAIPMFMCPTPIGVSIVGEPIAYRLRLLGEGEAELARAEVTLVPRCPDDQRDLCARICTG